MYEKWVKTHVFSSFLHKFDDFSDDPISKNDVNSQGNTNMMFLLLEM